MTTTTPPPRLATRAVRARAQVVIGRGVGGRARLERVRTQPPLGVRLAGGEVHLVGTAMGPLGGDDLGMQVQVRPATHVTVRSVAATVALPGDGTPSRHHLTVAVGERARLVWAPEPLVAAAGCDHTATTEVALAPDADLVWVERQVLGRTGEDPGRLRTSVRIERGGHVLVHHGIDTSVPDWAGPAVMGSDRATGMAVLVGATARTLQPAARVDHACGHLADDVAVVVATASDALGVERILAAVVPGWRHHGTSDEQVR